MIVRQFISWVRTASACVRADATRALARAWLVSDLSGEDRAAAEGALLMLLDDPSLLVLADLPAATRAALVAKLSETLAQFVVARNWLSADRAGRVVSEARDRSTMNIAARSRGEDMRGLVRHLRATGQLTAGLILRALLSGNQELFESAMAELSGLPQGRVS